MAKPRRVPRFVHDDIAKQWTNEPVRNAVKHVTVISVVIVAIVVLVVRWMGGGQSTPGGKSPQDILKERYARGEMTTKEFEERRKVLGD